MVNYLDQVASIFCNEKMILNLDLYRVRHHLTKAGSPWIMLVSHKLTQHDSTNTILCLRRQYAITNQSTHANTKAKTAYDCSLCVKPLFQTSNAQPLRCCASWSAQGPTVSRARCMPQTIETNHAGSVHLVCLGPLPCFSWHVWGSGLLYHQSNLKLIPISEV